MTSPDYKKKMDELRNKVSQYIPNKKSTRVMNINIPTFNIKSIYFYIVPPIVILIVLLLSKPSFIRYEHIDENNVITQKINYKYLIIFTLIGGTIIDIGLFAYFKKTNII